jgi:probable rRNA maturation factor
VVVSDRKMATLNRAFRGVAKTTDVLAFSMQEGPGVEWFPHLLGDVVVSAERALFQAEERRHSLEKEISLLVIHGLLHLLGWDDQSEADRRKMLRMQTRIFRQVFPEGLSDRPPAIGKGRSIAEMKP